MLVGLVWKITLLLTCARVYVCVRCPVSRLSPALISNDFLRRVLQRFGRSTSAIFRIHNTRRPSRGPSSMEDPSGKSH